MAHGRCDYCGACIASNHEVKQGNLEFHTACTPEARERAMQERTEPVESTTDALARVDVLDRGYVELLGFLGGEDAVVDAARVSFGKQASHYTDEQNERLTAYLLKHDHGSPFEMVTFKFRVHAPVVVWWQWVRHRIASFNFISGRYVEFDESEVYEPLDWRLQSKDNKQGSSGEMLDAEQAAVFNAERGELFQAAFNLYGRMVNAGVAKEQARLVLPFSACYYTAIVQMNARSLMNFLRLRCDGHAQSEIRDYAEAVRSIVQETHPRIFKR